MLDSELYFKELVVYIHTNPLHHGIVSEFSKYHWSSYPSFIKNYKMISLGDTVSWFNSIDDFIEYHNMRKEKIRLDQEF
jgi:hypothetical protein